MVVGEGLSEEMVLGRVLRDTWPSDSSREECSGLKEKQVQRLWGGDSSRFEGQRQPQWLDPSEGRAGEGREQVESQVARASD